MNITDVYLSRHEDVKELAERIGKDIGSLGQLTTTDKENIVAAINEIKQAQSEIVGRIEALEEYHQPVEQGLAKDYPGTGWYKATDTGVVYNKDIPEGETHIFEGDPVEYISVWRNEGIDLTTFTGSEEDGLKLLDWHRNLHRYATSNVTDMSYWMYIYGNDVMYRIMGISPDLVITDPVDISHYDTSNVTNMEYMFTNATSFNQSLDNFDTSNVTNMERMFYEATTFNQPLDSFDTSNVTNMSNMFYGAEAFNQSLDNFITSNVTNMKYMFGSASSFNQDISSWDTSKVEDMEYMFHSATTFNQDLSQWCVPLLSTVPTRFDYNATSWTLPKPVWGTCPRGEDGSEPKPKDTGLDKDYPGHGWYKATDTGIIYNKGVPEGETHVFSDGNPTEYLSVYTKEDAVDNIYIAATSNVTDLSSAFFDEEEFKSFYGGENLSHWDVSNVTNFEKMFFYAQAQDIVGIGNWKTSSATNMARMFTMANTFNTDISGWDVSNVTDMESMFTQAMTFNQDISGWNVSNVENMGAMFNFAYEFNQDLSEWCVAKIPTRPEGWEGYENIVPPVWGTCPRGERVELV